MPNQTVFTIGHSTHDIGRFIGLLNKHEVDCLIDVRSQPYSRFVPQFNKDELRSKLESEKIKYLHFEKEFGARHTKPSLLDVDNKVDFGKVRETAEFKQGIQRLRNGLDKGYTIALMCSEADPFDCHRFSMISYQLAKEEVCVSHILKNGNLKENSDLEKQLLEKYNKKLPQNESQQKMSFSDTEDTKSEEVTREKQIEHAYQLRGKDIAFSLKHYGEKQ